MRLSISTRFTLKDKPEGYLGLTGEHWSFGKDRPRTMSELAYDFLSVLFEWHLRWLTIEEASHEKQRLMAWLNSIAFQEEIDSPCGEKEGLCYGKAIQNPSEANR